MSQVENKNIETNSVVALREAWESLDLENRRAIFFGLPRVDAEELFLSFYAEDQYELIDTLAPLEIRSWIRLLAPDDAADIIQVAPNDRRDEFLNLLDDGARREVVALLAYAEDEAGGLMSPRFIRLRPDVTADIAIRYIRIQARQEIELFHYAYVLDYEQKLLGVVTFKELFLAQPLKLVSEIMNTSIVSVREDMDQEEIGRLFSQHDLLAIPVVNDLGQMQGIVTLDDIVTVVEEEATEDIQKLGGVSALETSFLKIPLLLLFQKRVVWLMVLFVSEMFTASAMGYYEHEIAKAVVLAIFIPLIISSGGNSGSQASTLVIRALALHEIRIKDIFRVLSREVLIGIMLGLTLGILGYLRIVFWPNTATIYGPHYELIGMTVAVSLVGVTLWGTLVGSTLPFVLKKLNLDPATASAPFVATLVDVTGLIIYFSVAKIFLTGALF